MRAASITPLLLRARDAGLTLRAEDGYVVATPKARLTPELRDEIALHKAELLEVLVWDEEAAVALLRAAAVYLNEPYLRAGSPDLPEERFFDAHVARDMFAYRIAVREWVQAALREIERVQRTIEVAETPAVAGEVQRDALHAKWGRRVPDPRVRSRRRERGVREPAGSGS